MIPKALHRIWVGSTLPAEFVEYGETWRKHHPSWHHVLWTDKEIHPHMPGVEVRNLRDILFGQSLDLYDHAADYAPNHVGQFKADIGRYEILLRLGGVYVDTDFECKRPLDELIEGLECFAAWETTDVWIGNAIMGAAPWHPFIDALVTRLPDNVKAMRGVQRPNKLTGPQFLTRIYRARDRGLTVLPKDLFYPYLYNELERLNEPFPDAVAVHHWANARRKLVRT